MYRYLTFGLLFLFFVLGLHRQGTSQTINYPSFNNLKVNGLSNMRSPFNNSQAYLDMGVGYSEKFDTDGLPVGDSTILKLRNELVYVGLGVGYQQKNQRLDFHIWEIRLCSQAWHRDRISDYSRR